MSGIKTAVAAGMVLLAIGVYCVIVGLYSRYTETKSLLVESEHRLELARGVIDRMDAERKRLDALLVIWNNDKQAVKTDAEALRNKMDEAFNSQAARTWADVPIPQDVVRLLRERK